MDIENWELGIWHGKIIYTPLSLYLHSLFGITMLISLERSGGFAGISQENKIDTGELSQSQNQRLTMLLESANFFSLPVYIAADSKQCDRFQYILTIEDRNRKHTVTIGESAMSEKIRTLIEWIKTNS